MPEKKTTRSKPSGTTPKPSKSRSKPSASASEPSASARAEKGARSQSEASPAKKAGAKRSSKGKDHAGSSTKGKKTTGKRVARAVAAKTTEVLGEMLAGAAVGAVTGAAERVSDQPTAFHAEGSERAIEGERKPAKGEATKASPRKRSTGKKSAEVVNEMLSGAAVGAVTGAAKAVIPTKTKGGKGRAGSK